METDGMHVYPYRNLTYGNVALECHMHHAEGSNFLCLTWDMLFPSWR